MNLRYYRPFRKLLIFVSDHVPTWLENRILDYLYPSDCEIHFL